MVMVLIPSLDEIGPGIGYVTNGACDMASATVQHWVNSPTTAQLGLNVLASHIQVLEHLVVKLQMVAQGVEQVHANLTATHQIEWHSPAGQAFREAVGNGQTRAQHLENTARETVRLAQASIEELHALVAGLQSLLAAARASIGDTVFGAIEQVCS